MSAGDMDNTTIHQQGGNAEPAHVSRRHPPPGGHVFFILCRNGSHGDVKEEMGHPRKPPTSLALLYLIQKGPLKSLLSISPTYGKIETQKAGKLLSLSF